MHLNPNEKKNGRGEVVLFECLATFDILLSRKMEMGTDFASYISARSLIELLAIRQRLSSAAAFRVPSVPQCIRVGIISRISS